MTTTPQNTLNKVPEVHHERCIRTDTQTLGRYIYNGQQIAVVLELPWKDNERKVSCIPAGKYRVIRRWSAKHKNHFHITGVPNRDMILIHIANHTEQLEGCQAPGQFFTFMDKNATIDVINSGNTLRNMLAILPKEFDLIITEKY
jgi:hypothetical protein